LLVNTESIGMIRNDGTPIAIEGSNRSLWHEFHL